MADRICTAGVTGGWPWIFAVQSDCKCINLYILSYTCCNEQISTVSDTTQSAYFLPAALCILLTLYEQTHKYEATIIEDANTHFLQQSMQLQYTNYSKREPLTCIYTGKCIYSKISLI